MTQAPNVKRSQWVKITGIPELRKRLDSLESDLRHKLLVEALKRSLDTMLKAAKAKVPAAKSLPWAMKGVEGEYKGLRHKGGLAAGFRIKKMRAPNPFEIEVQLQNTAYTAMWVEYGHDLKRGKKWSKSQRVVGHTSAQPFMRPAFAAHAAGVYADVVAAIQGRLVRLGV